MDAELAEETAKYRGTSRPFFLFFKGGEQVEVVEGVNSPAVQKVVADQIPEGLVDLAEKEEGEGDDGDE